MTLLSRFFGFLRDLGSAQIFGASPVFSAFLVAFQLPNFLRSVIAEGGFAQAFIPVFSDIERKGKQESVAMVASLTWVMLLITILLALLGVYFSSTLVRLYAPGFSEHSLSFQLAVQYLHWTFPCVVTMSICAIASAWLQCHHRFALAASMPVFMNLVLLAAIGWGLMVPQQDHLLLLAKSVPIAGLLQCLLVWGQCIRLGYTKHMQWQSQIHAGVRRIGRLVGGSFLGTSVGQLGILIDTCFASFLPLGSIAWLYYTARLVYLPLGLIGVGVATVILPKLSIDCAGGDEKQFLAHMNWGIRLVLFVAIPSALGLMVMAYPIVVTLFQYKAFTVHDAWMTHLSVVAYASGLPAFMLVKVLTNGFYAHQDTKTPVKIACVSLLLNVVLSYLLMQIWQHVGLFFATVLAAYLQCIILIFTLQKRYLKEKSLSFAHWQTMIMASLCMALGLIWVQPILKFWTVWPASTRFVALSWRLLFGMVIYLVVMSLCHRPRVMRTWLTELH